MIPENTPIFGLRFMLDREKKEIYKVRKRRIAWLLANFLQTNQLTTRKIVEGDSVPDDFLLIRSDLTDEGFELIKLGMYNWLGYLDTRMESESTVTLENTLKKIRKGG